MLGPSNVAASKQRDQSVLHALRRWFLLFLNVALCQFSQVGGCVQHYPCQRRTCCAAHLRNAIITDA